MDNVLLATALIAALMMAAAAVFHLRKTRTITSPIPSDYFGLCPRCCREPVRRDVESQNFMCCDYCKIYWWVGSVVRADEQPGTRELLNSYEPIEN
jgi:hypothetical protein